MTNLRLTISGLTILGLTSLGGMLALSSCAYVGGPQPPTLDIPQTVTDLRVGEFGDHLRIEFTLSPETTEGLPLKGLRSLEMGVGVAPEPWSDEKWAALAKRYEIPYSGPGTINFDKASVQEWVGKEVVIRVRAIGPKGKASGWSNIKQLPIEPPLATPANLTIENARAGLYLKWNSPAKKFRIFRKANSEDMPTLITDTDPNPDWSDGAVEFGTTYTYYVQAFSGDYQQSEVAATPPTLRADTFAPPTPTGLVVEPGANSIELSWERITEPRFQGYNVYRSVEGGPFEKIASTIVAPSYSDKQIEAGKKYRYAISAVGTNGIEGERCTPVETTAQ